MSKKQKYLDSQFDIIDSILGCPKCPSRLKEVWLVRTRTGENIIRKGRNWRRRKYVVCKSCGFDLASIKQPKQDGK